MAAKNQALRRYFASIGGRARARKLSKRRRVKIAQMGGYARHHGQVPDHLKDTSDKEMAKVE